MLKVELQDFDALTDAEKMGASNNGCGREWANYLRVTHNGETLFLENDAMEPEDIRFTRDLSWVRDAILKAYELGRVDATGVNEG
jgi:hypothetical protein